MKIILVSMLALILMFAGCDNEADDAPTPFEGTWHRQNMNDIKYNNKIKYTFKGKEFTTIDEEWSNFSMSNYKGKFTYTDTQLAITWTHNYSGNDEWYPERPAFRTIVDYALNGDTLFFSNNLIEGEGWNVMNLNGTWIRQR
ncbi:MAG: hypothetical protein LBH44_03685 [Treponema sp.]|jgi:uncharacterized lipoprotein NlpE involved in copper resistance|nr:hypothetical protein [Treponema sp.]